MPKKNFKNIGALQGYEYVAGVIDSIDGGNDTCGLTIGEDTFADVPIFYHCNPESEERDNGALEGAAGAFADGDDVIVLRQREKEQIGTTGLYHDIKLFVIGHVGHKRHCEHNFVICFILRTEDSNINHYKIVEINESEITEGEFVVEEYPIYAPDAEENDLPLTQPFIAYNYDAPPGYYTVAELWQHNGVSNLQIPDLVPPEGNYTAHEGKNYLHARLGSIFSQSRSDQQILPSGGVFSRSVDSADHYDFEYYVIDEEGEETDELVEGITISGEPVVELECNNCDGMLRLHSETASQEAQAYNKWGYTPIEDTDFPFVNTPHLLVTSGERRHHHLREFMCAAGDHEKELFNREGEDEDGVPEWKNCFRHQPEHSFKYPAAYTDRDRAGWQPLPSDPGYYLRQEYDWELNDILFTPNLRILKFPEEISTNHKSLLEYATHVWNELAFRRRERAPGDCFSAVYGKKDVGLSIIDEDGFSRNWTSPFFATTYMQATASGGFSYRFYNFDGSWDDVEGFSYSGQDLPGFQASGNSKAELYTLEDQSLLVGEQWLYISGALSENYSRSDAPIARYLSNFNIFHQGHRPLMPPEEGEEQQEALYDFDVAAFEKIISYNDVLGWFDITRDEINDLFPLDISYNDKHLYDDPLAVHFIRRK